MCTAGRLGKGDEFVGMLSLRLYKLICTQKHTGQISVLRSRSGCAVGASYENGERTMHWTVPVLWPCVNTCNGTAPVLRPCSFLVPIQLASPNAPLIILSRLSHIHLKILHSSSHHASQASLRLLS
eukprot:3925106-Pleurochrysis_carterae.AAC.1